MEDLLDRKEDLMSAGDLFLHVDFLGKYRLGMVIGVFYELGDPWYNFFWFSEDSVEAMQHQAPAAGLVWHRQNFLEYCKENNL